MRVRAMGLAALALVAGASLVPNSTGSDPTPRSDARNLNFTLSTESVADEEPALPPPSADEGAGVWALRGPAANKYDIASGPTAAWEGPDGVRFVPLSLKMGRGPMRPVLTNASTAEELFRALRVELNAPDLVLPGPDVVLRPGMDIEVVRIRRVLESFLLDVPFPTLIRESRELAMGNVSVLHEGKPGEMVKTYRITYRNGREVRRVEVAQVVLRAPIPEVVLEGTGGIAGVTTGTLVGYGEASWYDFCRVDGMYAAHRTLPFGTVVTVTNLDNGKSVTVVINDRGPFGIPHRIIDLCDSAFAVIAPLEQGVARIRLTWSA